MDINFNGFQEAVLTLECESTVQAGDFVLMSASEKVRTAADTESFIGKCLSVKDGFAAVQLKGYVEAKKGGNVSVGVTKLVVGTDGVKGGSAGKECLVISLSDEKVGFIL